MLFSAFKKLKKATPESDEKLRENMEENDVGFSDGLAMAFSAFLTIVLPCALILCGIALLALWAFGAL